MTLCTISCLSELEIKKNPKTKPNPNKQTNEKQGKKGGGKKEKKVENENQGVSHSQCLKYVMPLVFLEIPYIASEGNRCQFI